MPKAKADDLLQQRIEEFNIPDLPWWPTFDRVLAYQIDDKLSKQDKIGSIYLPETTQSTKDGSKRLVIVGAGLKALDILRSNGIELGHIVTETQFGNIDFVIDRKAAGENVQFRVARAEDITGSEDLLANLKEGLAEIVLDDNGKHQLKVDPKTRGPVNPFSQRSK
jgi:hypothetical protein